MLWHSATTVLSHQTWCKIHSEASEILIQYPRERYMQKSQPDHLFFIESIETASVPILWADSLGNFIYANKAASQYLQYSQKELCSMTVSDIDVCLSTDRQLYGWNLIKEKKAISIDSIQKKKDGTLVNVSILLSYLCIDGLEMSMGIITPRDISDEEDRHLKGLARANEKLDTLVKEKTAELEQIADNLDNKMKAALAENAKNEAALFAQQKFADMGRIMNAIAHHWRQPLNVIGLLTQDMCEMMQNGTPSKEYMDLSKHTIMDTLMELSDTIDKFRSFFKTDGKVEDFHVLDVVAEVLNMLRTQLDAYDISFKLTCRCGKKSFSCENTLEIDGCPVGMTLLKGLVVDFKHAVLNVVSNSVDSILERRETESGISGKIEFLINVEGGFVTLYVVDNGVPVPDELSEKIFEPYFTTKEEGKGAGIGLYMCKIIIEDYFGGRISLRSNAGSNICAMKVPVK